MSEYATYLRSMHWRSLRRRLLFERGARCELCGVHGIRTNDVPLDVHHLTYERLGAEHDDDLAVLCRSCHTQLHELRREPHLRSLKAIRLATNFEIYKALVSGEGVEASLLDQHWLARYQP